MDPNTALETAKEGAKAFTKLGDIVEKFLGPKWTRKQADADKYANDKKLELIRENPDMEIIFVNGEMSAREKTLMELEQRADQRLLAEKIRQEVNLEKVLDIAAKDLEFDNTEIAEDNNVDDDWIVRLFNIVKDVSNEDMQLLWGKILAGEIKQPGSFSLRMLDVIKNISKYEAEAFQKVSTLLIGGEKEIFIVAEDKIYKKYSINFSDILLLDECGLIISNGTLSYNMTVTPERGKYIICNDYVIMITNTSAEDLKVSCSVYTLTNVGKQLFNVLSPSVNREYVLDVAEHLWDKHKEKLIISVHALSHFEADGFIYNTIPIKEYKKENA